MDFDSQSLINIEKFAIELAFSAGRMMSSAACSGSGLIVDQKQHFADLVTNADKEIEAYVFGEIKKRFSDHELIGEESMSDSSKFEYSNKPTWIIDPIDGTTNFVHSFPFVCISIGFAVNKQLLLGVIYNPFSEKLYTARKGNGAYCNGAPIKVRNCLSIKNALIVGVLAATGRPDRYKKYIENADALSWISHGFRDVGSAALSVCLVASGFADAYYHFGLHCWDMAAGVVILTEAGGIVVDTNGGPFDVMSRRFIVACNSMIAEAIVSNIRHQIQTERECIDK